MSMHRLRNVNSLYVYKTFLPYCYSKSFGTSSHTQAHRHSHIRGSADTHLTSLTRGQLQGSVSCPGTLGHLIRGTELMAALGNSSASKAVKMMPGWSGWRWEDVKRCKLKPFHAKIKPWHDQNTLSLCLGQNPIKMVWVDTVLQTDLTENIFLKPWTTK